MKESPKEEKGPTPLAITDEEWERLGRDAVRDLRRLIQEKRAAQRQLLAAKRKQ